MSSAPSGVAPGLRNSLALIAENDVVVDTSAGCTTDYVRAALVAATGAVTIPREHRGSVLVGPSAPTCPNIDFVGSIASHGSIIMRWRIGPANVGYVNRSYRWDPWLAYFPPPFVPLAHPWELSGLEVASGDCFAPGSGGVTCE